MDDIEVYVLMKRLIVLLIVITRLSVLSGAELPEYVLKTAFLYNFALLIDWPDTMQADQFKLCFYQSDFGSISDTLKTKTIHNKSVAVTTVTMPDEVKGCHVLFLKEDDLQKANAFIEAVDSKTTLIVSEYPDMLTSHINIVRSHSKLQFDINLENLQHNSTLLPSSHLLKLAHKINRIP